MPRGAAWLLLLAASLAAAEEAPAPPAPAVTVQETTLATVVSTSVAAKRFVADHAEALEVHLRNTAGLGAPPVAKPRIEVADVPGLADLAVGVSGGHVLVAVRLGSPEQAPLRAGEAAARATSERRPVSSVSRRAASSPPARMSSIFWRVSAALLAAARLLRESPSRSDRNLST